MLFQCLMLNNLRNIIIPFRSLQTHNNNTNEIHHIGPSKSLICVFTQIETATATLFYVSKWMAACLSGAAHPPGPFFFLNQQQQSKWITMRLAIEKKSQCRVWGHRTQPPLLLYFSVDAVVVDGPFLNYFYSEGITLIKWVAFGSLQRMLLFSAWFARWWPRGPLSHSFKLVHGAVSTFTQFGDMYLLTHSRFTTGRVLAHPALYSCSGSTRRAGACFVSFIRMFSFENGGFKPISFNCYVVLFHPFCCGCCFFLVLFPSKLRSISMADLCTRQCLGRGHNKRNHMICGCWLDVCYCADAGEALVFFIWHSRTPFVSVVFGQFIRKGP